MATTSDPEPFRGSVDDRANVHFVSGTLNLDYLGDFDHLAIRLDTLAEERQNGTVLQTNSTGLGTFRRTTRTTGSTTNSLSLASTRESNSTAGIRRWRTTEILNG